MPEITFVIRDASEPEDSGVNEKNSGKLKYQETDIPYFVILVPATIGRLVVEVSKFTELVLQPDFFNNLVWAAAHVANQAAEGVIISEAVVAQSGHTITVKSVST